MSQSEPIELQLFLGKLTDMLEYMSEQLIKLYDVEMQVLANQDQYSAGLIEYIHTKKRRALVGMPQEELNGLAAEYEIWLKVEEAEARREQDERNA